MGKYDEMIKKVYEVVMKRRDVAKKAIDDNILKGAVLIESMLDAVITASLLRNVHEIENPPEIMSHILQTMSMRDKIEVLKKSNVLDSKVCGDLHKLNDVRNAHAHVHEKVEEQNFDTKRFDALQEEIITSFFKSLDPAPFHAAALSDALDEVTETKKPV